MIVIDNMLKYDSTIEIEKIKPFYNICPITKQREEMNIEIVYKPNKHLLELGSYREFFKNGFDCYVEEIAQKVFDHINKLIKPKELKVRVFMLEEKLTPWTVEIVM
tara:strand:+ start:497 stop:814 length:318 start_codon:yes stop_codon:yes gene_type:complete